MKIAIPVYENRISPRFDCAYQFLIVSLENVNVINKETKSLRSINPMQRINELVEMGIDTLICGAVNEFTYRMIAEKGIEVIHYVIGNVDEVLDLYIKGELNPGESFFPDGRRMCKRIRFGGGRGRRGRCWSGD